MFNWRMVGLAVALAGVFAAAIARAADNGHEQAVESANQWLSLVDRGEYKKAWKSAASFMQGAIAADKFQSQVSGVRVPLGKVVSRKLAAKTYRTSLPGAPDGQYVIIQFNTTFENKKSAVETITPMVDTDGSWKVSGYYIR